MRARILLLIAAVLPAALAAQEPDTARIGRVEQGLVPPVVAAGQAGQKFSIANRMAYHGVSALSVAVIDDGKVVWARAYGVRGRADSTPITTATPFQVASVSKTASAFGAMLLVQQGRLGLDDDIRPRLKSWDPGQALTLRQLLSHT